LAAQPVLVVLEQVLRARAADAGERLVLRLDVAASLRAVALDELVANPRELLVARAAGDGPLLPGADRLLLIGEAAAQLLAFLLRFGERLFGVREPRFQRGFLPGERGEPALELAVLRFQLSQLSALDLLDFQLPVRFVAGFLSLRELLRELGLVALELRLLRSEPLIRRLQPARRVGRLLVLRVRAGEEEHGEQREEERSHQKRALKSSIRASIASGGPSIWLAVVYLSPIQALRATP
jgi:hypothetical protein